MNIALINHYAGSKQHGMEYRPFYLAREWTNCGHNVCIISASFTHLRNRNPQISGYLTEEMIEGVRYLWIRTPSYHGNGIGRFVNIISFIKGMNKIDDSILGFSPDVVIASSTYPFDIYPAKHLQKKYLSKLVFEVHDLWPLTLIELAGMSKWHPFIVFMQQAENYAYQKADRVVSILPKAYEYMQNHGMSPEKFVYIPNGISKEEWENNNSPVPQQHSELLTRLREEKRFIIGYTGSHGLTDTLDTLIESASLLKNRPVTFLLVGQGPEKERLGNKASKSGLENVIFLPPVQKSSIPRLLDTMDMLYVGCKKKSIYRFGVSPNKLFDYMMAGKPIIHAIEAGNNLVDECCCGISIQPENPAAVVGAVQKLISMGAAERTIMGVRGKEYVLANHDYKVLAKRFLSALIS
ncbi:MAG: glycosyltransferase family 4 protein [Nitrospirota bacterium]